MSSRFYSLSSQVNREKEGYYHALEDTQAGSLDITAWLTWYFGCVERAIESAEAVFETVFLKARLCQRLAPVQINDRQRHMIELLFGSFVGHLTAAKWAEITKTSPPVALRDMNDLAGYGVLRKIGDRRGTHYELLRDAESLDSSSMPG